jgi:hypothetical protein
MATRPGHPGRANEDFVGAVPGAVVLLDGAGIRGSEHLCRHGTAWFAHRLGTALLARLPASADLAALLAESISEVAALHHDTCDLADPSSPPSPSCAPSTTGSTTWCSPTRTSSSTLPHRSS